MPNSAELPWEELDANLRAFIGRRVRNPADVDDLVQRVLLQIVKGLDSLRDLSRLHAWVYRTARNVLIDYYRAAAPKHEVMSGLAEDVDDAAAIQTLGVAVEDEPTALAELACCLDPMVRQLTPEYRDALVKVDLQGVPQTTAAAEAGVSVSGMKSRVQRARRQLRAVLEACCRIDLDRRGGVMGYESRAPRTCKSCG